MIYKSDLNRVIKFRKQQKLMESLEKLRKNETQSHMLMTLNKQVEALAPIRLSYNNLANYHQKISIDLASLIDEHDYALSSLKSNLQNLTAIVLRTQAEKNDLNIQFKDRQNQIAKLVLDTRNLAQKYDSLNQKLQLESNRTDQNISYKNQLLKIQQTLKTHIASIQAVNNQLAEQQFHLKQQQTLFIDRIEKQEIKRQQQLSKGDLLKSSIAKLNIQNDDLTDGNRKLSQEIGMLEDEWVAKGKLNRELKERLIEQKSIFEKLKNQILYKLTVLETQEKGTIDLNGHEANLSNLITQTTSEKNLVEEENIGLLTDLDRTESQIKENLAFKLNAENHLAQLKQTNEILLAKMEQYCFQDRQIQNLLLKKMQSLDFFAQKLHQKYESQQIQKVQTISKSKVSIPASPKHQNSTLMDTFVNKLFRSEKFDTSNTKYETKTSQKSWKRETQ